MTCREEARRVTDCKIPFGVKKGVTPPATKQELCETWAELDDKKLKAKVFKHSPDGIPVTK
jgi:hypothetical protein